ncbi:ABC transporter ATP-binding protein [Weissella ceti]|uniref:ABC transporter ATP-binding protein n=1 Tax=Weissella ceti TaxID=759620 RepID=UPI001BCC7D47|nr:ABC transporter ATP-binding protein [Weissella ceti]QVK12611.1 ABC transporter ATP-binding protein [Weissella ceti]
MTSLKLDNISKVFGTGSNQVTALNNIDFEAKSGELTLIIGPSGSGKSTLLTILGGLQTPTSGKVLLNDQKVEKYTPKKLEQLRLNDIGFVLQSYNLVPYLTVQQQFDLVTKVKKTNNMSDRNFETVIDQLDIRSLLSKYPNELSGGQTQRVAIARAMFPNPSIILADEPTAALDTSRVMKVGEMLHDIAHTQKKAVVTVTHDQRLLEYADHVYELVDGKLSQQK